MTADLWAGAEVQVATTASYLVERPDVCLSVVLFNDGRLAAELRTLGIDVAIIDETRHGAAGIVTFLAEFFRDRRIELVHTHRYKDTVLGTIAAKLAGVPCIVRTMHGLREPMRGWNQVKFRAYEALDRLVLRCFANRVIAVSQRMADVLADSAYRQSLMTTIHNGIDLRTVAATRARADVRRELGVDDHTIVIGTAGRLSPVKGHDVLLRAARLVLERDRNVVFVIAGAGPLQQPLSDFASRLRIDSAVRMLGARHDVHDLMAAMDIFVLPSLNEGLPMAILEAMAAGKPVIASAVGGIPEVVQPRVSGLLVPPGDARALANACLELVSNPEQLQRMGAAGRRIAHGKFSHEHNGRALMETYRRVGQESRRVTAVGLCVGLARRFLQYGARAWRHAIERGHMRRIRRRPDALTAALKTGKQILVVCHGNIIRSPFAAFLLARELGRQGQVTIVSAGLEATPGRPAHPTALATAASHHIDLRPHAASRLDLELVAKSDVIFVMEIEHLVSMRRRFPEARSKTFLLSCLAPETPLEIRDPFGGDESLFRACYDHITCAVRPLAGVIAQAQPS